MTQAAWVSGSVLEEANPGEAWMVLCTRSNQEDRVSRSCEYLGVRHYLPLMSVEDPQGEMKEVPLFPGYLFACPDETSRQELLSIGPTIRTLVVRKPDLLLRELRQVDTALSSWRGVGSGPALSRGHWVRVWKGPLVGVEGVITHRRFRRRRERLVLNVTMLGQAATLEIDSSYLQPVDPSTRSEPGRG